MGTKEGGAKYVLNHWFRNEKGIIRTTLANLWWSVYCSIDESRGKGNEYDLTKILFMNMDFRVVRFGTSTLFRHREAMIGILEFFYEHPELTKEHLSSRGQYLVVYFNRLGAIKELSTLDRSFFKQECESKYDILLQITSRDLITNNDEIYDI